MRLRLRLRLRLRRGGSAAHMKPITQKDLARRYGYLLDYCHHHGSLDRGMPAGRHVTPETIEPFLAELKARVGFVTVAQTICKIRRAAETYWSNQCASPGSAACFAPTKSNS
jgi:hypothetical protein